MRSLILKTDGTIEALDHLPTYADLNEAVGGWIEAVPLRNDAVMWANEEGLLKELPANQLATQLVRMFSAAGDVTHGGSIVGNVVLTGRDDPEVADLPEWVFLALRNMGVET